MNMNKTELKKKVKAALDRDLAFVAKLEHETNPQTIAMVQRARGSADALDAVYQALCGCNVFLNIMAPEVKRG
jgi:hypothetical protein